MLLYIYMQKIIDKLGLDKSEAVVYTALLELGPSSVTEITKKAGITRTLGYHVLEKLGWYGLVDQVSSKSKKIIYTAKHPRFLLQHIKNKKNEWERNFQEVEGLLPELLSLYKFAEKPSIKFQEGKNGVINLFEESLESKTEILSILDVESWQKPELWDWARKYNRERNKRKIKERILILDTPVGREWIRNYRGSRSYTIYRWIEPSKALDMLRFGGELNIYENRVMIALLEQSKRMGILMESSILTNILRAMFELVWVNAKPVKFGK